MYFKSILQKLIFITGLALVACQPAPKNSQASTNTDSTAALVSVREISTQIEADPDNAELYYQRAIIYFNEKYMNRALTDIEDATNKDAQNPLYQYYKGKILYAMNRTLDASKAYESALALKPDYTEAQLKLAELYYVVKEHTKSINLVNTILGADPLNANAMILKADNQRELKDTAKAIASYQKTLELDPTFYDAAMQLGLLNTARKDKSAPDYFTAAIRINPKSTEAYFGRAYYYQQTKQYQKALFDYRKVIDIDPSNDRAYYNVGMINFDAEKYEEALRSFNICVQMNNNYTEAYYMRGLVHEELNNKADAKLSYQYALQLSPNYVLAQEGLKRVE
jgi:tetratricopeptide (TPR) repeat protein